MTTNDQPGEPLDPPSGKPVDCCLCGNLIVGYGNNPDPLADGSRYRCCDDCNTERVIPARLTRIGNVIGGHPNEPRDWNWVMVGQWRASDGNTAVEGLYLEMFDPEAFDGLGDAVWTDDPDKAMRFADAMEVLKFWRQPSKTRPLRADGEPNRPLTAFTVEPRNLR